MATCKECLHHDACLTVLKSSFPNIQEKEIEQICTRENDCRNFKFVSDVVEVVRCKKCVHYANGCCNHFGYHTYSPDVDEDDFCSYGERRANG